MANFEPSNKSDVKKPSNLPSTDRETLKDSADAPTTASLQKDRVLEDASITIGPRVRARKEEAIEFSLDKAGSLSFEIPPSGSGGLARRLGKFFEKLADKEHYPVNLAVQGIELKIVCSALPSGSAVPLVGTAVFARSGRHIHLVSASDTNGREINLKKLVAQNVEAEKIVDPKITDREQAERMVISVKKNILGILNEDEASKLQSSIKMPDSAREKILKIEETWAKMVRAEYLREKVSNVKGWAHNFELLTNHAKEHETISPHLDALILALHPQEMRYRSVTKRETFMQLAKKLSKAPGLIEGLTQEGRDKKLLAPVFSALLNKLWGVN